MATCAHTEPLVLVQVEQNEAGGKAEDAHQIELVPNTPNVPREALAHTATRTVIR